MMKLVFNLGVALLFIGLAIPLTAEGTGFPPPHTNAQWNKSEFTKTIKKEFPINANGTTSLSNKYGKMDVKTWDKNRVKVDVTIIVKATSESQAKGVFERIKIDFANDADFVKAATVIESKKSTWWGWDSHKTEFKINYEVFMPKSGSLELSHKYGDAFISEIDGKADIAMSYGNFRLEGAGNDLEIKLNYGAGTIVKARDVTGKVSYSKLRIKESEDIALTSKNSKVTIEKGTDVKTDSSYDTYSLGTVREFKCQGKYCDVEIAFADNVVANSRYTDFYIEKVGDRADFDLQFGGVTVEKIAKGFSEVSLVGKYTDYKIAIETNASYVLEANAEFAGINYPDNLNVTFEKDQGVSHEVKGHKGSQSARSVIKASLCYGGLRVK